MLIYHTFAPPPAAGKLIYTYINNRPKYVCTMPILKLQLHQGGVLANFSNVTSRIYAKLYTSQVHRTRDKRSRVLHGDQL